MSSTIHLTTKSAYVVLGSAMLERRPEVFLYRVMNHDTQRCLIRHAVIRGVGAIMCEDALCLTAISTLVRRTEVQPLTRTHRSSNGQQTCLKLPGPSISHGTLSRGYGKEGCLYYGVVEIERASYPDKQLCSLVYPSLIVLQPRSTRFRAYLRDRQNTKVHLPRFKDLTQN